jgi:hypothetical protein
MQLRFSLVLTTDAGLTKWEIHRAECPDVSTKLRSGAFVEVVSADSAEHFVKTELQLISADVPDKPYIIMPCCQDAVA